MARWEPDARGRLEKAALDLYTERGYDDTTVAEIAERAGVTERTFFRHYADKREVLFWGQEVLREAVVGAVGGAADDATPMQAVRAGLAAFAEVLHERLDHARRRQRIIAAHSALQERELIKMATLAQAMSATLRERGVAEPTASLSAETGIAVFRVAFERWIADGGDLLAHIDAALADLRAVTAT